MNDILCLCEFFPLFLSSLSYVSDDCDLIVTWVFKEDHVIYAWSTTEPGNAFLMPLKCVQYLSIFSSILPRRQIFNLYFLWRLLVWPGNSSYGEGVSSVTCMVLLGQF